MSFSTTTTTTTEHSGTTFKTLTFDKYPTYDANTYMTTFYFKDKFSPQTKYSFQCHTTGTLISGVDCYSPEIKAMCPNA